ncbi:MAG: hypothetical protein KDC24_13525 [Saprospiraceae bacterium]|nr:hypothetical protein [Saprospiraceae bacterium]
MVFEPLTSLASDAIIFYGILIVCIGATWLYVRKSKSLSKYKQLWAMLAFFGLLIGLGIAGMNFYLGERIGKVTITETAFETAYGTIPFDEVKDVVIYLDRKTSPFTGFKPGSETKRLLIITKGGKTYAFSEGNYPIDKMIEPMRSKVQSE